MSGQLTFLFQQGHFPVGAALRQAVGGGHTDNAPAHDGNTFHTIPFAVEWLSSLGEWRRPTDTAETFSMDTAADRLKQFLVPDSLIAGDQSAEACTRRLRLALQMSDDGLSLMEANLLRKEPDLTPEQLKAKLRAWLWSRPGSDEGWLRVNPERRFP